MDEGIKLTSKQVENVQHHTEAYLEVFSKKPYQFVLTKDLDLSILPVDME